MRSVRLYNRDVHLEQGHFWADAGDDFFIVARSLADVIVAAMQADRDYAAGHAPAWENKNNKVSVVADLATAIPFDAVPDFESGSSDPMIHRTEDQSGTPVFWVDHGGCVRAFLTAADATNWIGDVENHGIYGADTEHLLNLKIDGY